MAGFLLRRSINHLVLIVVAASLAYLLAAACLDPRSNYLNRTPRPPEPVVDAQLDQYNLNDKTPLFQRYLTWASGVLRGDFGRTWNGEAVGEDLARRIGVTLRLVLLGAVLGSVAGVLAGAYAAVRRHGLFDRLTSLASYVVLAVPTVVLANLLIIAAVWINDRTGSRFLMVSGEATPGLAGGPAAHAVDRIRHLILPTAALSLGLIALYSRYQRTLMLDVLGSDFIRTALAKGLRRRSALLRHGLRTAVIPMATYFAFTFGSLLAGAAFTEKIFGWHGVGEWIVTGIGNQDINIVAAITVLSAVMILLAGLLSDVIYAALDPRVRS